MIKPKFALNELVDVSPVPEWPQMGIIKEITANGYMIRLDGNWATRFYKESEIEAATEGMKLNHQYYKNYYNDGCDCGAAKASYPNEPAGHAYYCTKLKFPSWSPDDSGNYGF